jgi:3-oxoacyl-(acyl-carrier-protein) synthase
VQKPTNSIHHSSVAVTGIGLVAPGAIGIDAFRELLRSGRSAVAPVSRFDTGGLRAHSAALIDGFSPKKYIPLMKLRRMNGLSRLAMAACRLALDDAGIEDFEQPTRVGLSIGTTFGPVDTSAEYLREYVAKGAALAPPQLFAESVANAPGSHIAIEFGLQGFNLTFTQREASAMTGLMFAATQLVKGTVEAAISGGVDEMSEITFSVLDRIGALAYRKGDLEEAARPFDAHRNGMVLGEGAAILLLEPAGGERKAYGYVSGFGIAKDTTASISDWGEGVDSVVAAMRQAVEDAGIVPGEVDGVVASANASLRGDRLEARALKSFFGDAIPPVVAPKSYFGEYAAGGALQIVAALLMLSGQELFATPGFEQGEPGLELPIVTSRREASLKHILVNALSAGGGVISTVLSRDAR